MDGYDENLSCVCGGNEVLLDEVLLDEETIEFWTNFNNTIFEKYTEKEIKRLKFYFRCFNEYTFEKNLNYYYSCKFIDEKYNQDTISEFVDGLKDNYIRNIDRSLIDRFFTDLKVISYKL